MELYSTHIFLFPFQWYFTGGKAEHDTLEKRTSLEQLVRNFEETRRWRRRPYKPDNVLSYNEYNYFYDFVRDTMFDRQEAINKRSVLANLFYDIVPEQHTFSFEVGHAGQSKSWKEYTLLIDSIIVHLYSSGVGVLSFHLNNRKPDQKEIDDILKINQYGRRIYPPFFGMDHQMVAEPEKYLSKDFEKGLEITQNKELARSFRMIDPGWFEDFSGLPADLAAGREPFRLPGHIAPLFRDIPLIFSKSEQKSTSRQIYISPLLDDRMFCICWYGNDALAKELSCKVPVSHQEFDGYIRESRKVRFPVTATIQGGSPASAYNFMHHELWYKLLFVDCGLSTCQNMEMKEKLIDRHTYARWADYNTLFGITRYSFICISEEYSTLCKNDASFLINHTQTIYYKLIELCLVQRACILRFSDEVARISDMSRTVKPSLTDRVSSLYKQYIRFVNRVFFREITAQEQGIELYEMAQRVMSIPENVKDLDNEISELHHYVGIQEEQKTNRSLWYLTLIGASFVIPSFLAGFFGMNLFGEEDFKWIIPHYLVTISHTTWFVAAVVFNTMAVMTGLLFWIYHLKQRGIKQKEQ